ncbi:MAG: hypothetical protein II038_11715 [Lachnospiraceae bacterium]|nr:hypothetical protein [Lachnospiraceae bacterium]
MAHQPVVCFPLDLILMAVPPGHPAAAGAVLFGPLPARLDHGLAAIQARSAVGELRVPADMGIDGVHRQSQRGRDCRRLHTIDPHVVDGGFVFLTNNDLSSLHVRFCI